MYYLQMRGLCSHQTLIDHTCGEVWIDAPLRTDRWAAADLLP